MGTEWGSDRKASVIAKKVTSMGRLAGDPDAGVEGGQMVSGIRSIGSAALSCCAVAEGALDIWHEVGCWVSLRRKRFLEYRAHVLTFLHRRGTFALVLSYFKRLVGSQ